MRQNQWNIANVRLDKPQIINSLLSNERAVSFFKKDFGNLLEANPAAVFQPKSIEELQFFLSYAAEQTLPITIRGNGLSQGGQSLSVDGGINLSMQAFTECAQVKDQSIWIEANASFADLLNRSLPKKLAPKALPYNCNLSIGGVLSAGGMGAAAFREGPISSQVLALELVDSQGEKQRVSKGDPLFEACLGGQGQFAVITAACIKLQPISEHIHTVFMVYDDMTQWFKDMALARETADYMELFCSPSIQGAGLFEGQRKPFATWLYGMHLSFNFDNKLKSLPAFSPWKTLHRQQEDCKSYFLRHNPRFDFMQKSGQWSMIHPWYECFLPERVLKAVLPELLQSLPLYFANLVHVVPVANRRVGFTMFPESDSYYEIMILNPGIPESLKQQTLEIISALDKQLLAQGGKRYLSGYLGESVDDDYWRRHFGQSYENWCHLKKRFDPAGIFTSKLFQLD